MNFTELAINLPVPHPLFFATISGAHLYGFPSPDSDVDVRGSFVLPVDDLLGLQSLQETITRTYEHGGREIDFVAHDLRKFVMLMLKRNGYVLEQIYSPLIVRGGTAFEELRALARGCVVRHLVHHYRGFAHNQIALMQKQSRPSFDKINGEAGPRLKDLLYVYRVLLTGIHVLQTGEIEANLRHLNAHFHLPDIDELIARKITEGAPLTEGEAEAHRPRIDELLARLDDAFEKSALPEKPTNFAALNEFVIRTRKEISQRGQAATKGN